MNYAARFRGFLLASPIFPAERHAELREQVVYEAPDQQEPWEPPEWMENFNLSDQQTFWTILLSLVVLATLGVLIYWLLGFIERRTGGLQEGGAAGGAVAIDEIEEEAMVEEGVDDGLLVRAEAAGQYDVAIRLLYIHLLKQLKDAQLIRYRRDFSNRDYRRQLSGGPFSDNFRGVTDDYERYWYGKYPLDRLSYRLSYGKFIQLRQRIDALTQPEEEYV